MVQAGGYRLDGCQASWRIQSPMFLHRVQEITAGDGGSNDFLRKSFESNEVEVIPCAGEKAERHVSAEDVSAQGARLCLRHETPPIVPYRAADFNPGMAGRGSPICAERYLSGLFPGRRHGAATDTYHYNYNI